MSFTLRPYQQKAVQETAVSVRDHKRTILCVATGGGKSKMAISICLSALAKGRTVLVITESSKIYRQLDAEISGSVNINASERLHYIHANRLYLAMAQTLSRRDALIQQFRAMGEQLLIINDECHLGTATKLLQQFPAAMLIGLSATPAMKWAKHLPLLYKACTVGPQPHELVEMGYLSPYTHAQKFPKGLGELQTGNNGEFTDESQARVFDTENAREFLLADIQSATFTKAMIFCANINSAEELTTYLNDHNIQTATQHSKYDIRSEAKQAFELSAFERMDSGVNVCISVASMNKGYDFPPVDWVIWWRATTSLPLFLQGCGRGSRLAPGKSGWRVTDWGGNGRRFGRWDEPRDWQKMWNTMPKKRDSVAPVKECPACFFLLPTTARVCSNCGKELGREQAAKTISGVDTVMLEKKDPVIVALTGRRLSQLSPIELAQWSISAKKKPHAIRVAKAMEQYNPGFLETFAKAMGYKKGWIDFQMPQSGEKIDFFDKVVG